MSEQTESRSPISAAGPWIADLLRGAGLVALIFFVYQSVASAGYIWDDDVMLTNNGTVVGPFGLKEIWTTGAADVCPFTLTTLWVAHKLWDLAPGPYHLLNLGFHAATAVVLWRVLRSLVIPGAWLGAAIWAVHPVQVESVAWISEMKNTESGLFYMLAMLFFIRWQRENGPGRDLPYIQTLLCAALAMASKSSTVVLPLEFCLLQWWLQGRLEPRDLRKIAPFFVLAAIVATVTLWTQHLRGADDSDWVLPFVQRVQIAGAALWFYLAKLIWPYPLMMVYPPGTAVPEIPFQYLPLLAAVAGLAILWYNRNTWARPFFFVAAYFVIALLPVLGFVNNTIFQYSPVFDHFQYLASMAPLALVGAGLALLARRIESGPVWLPFAAGGVLVAVLAITSLRYSQVFQNETTLWNDVLAKNPACWPAYTNLAIEFGKEGQPNEALTYFRKALEIHPKNAQAENDLGLLLQRQGHADQALDHFRAAVEITPKYPHPHANIGDILAQRGQLDEAIEEYQKALEGAPNDPKIQVSLGVALAQRGRIDDAIPHFQKALSLDPKNVEAHYNLGNALLSQGRTDEAIDEFRSAEDLSPDDFQIHNNLGRALAMKGWLDESIAELRKAEKANPDNVGVHQNLGRLLGDKGETDEAITQLKDAVKLDDHDAKNHNYLGNVLLQAGKRDEAIAEYKKALDIDPTYADARRELGEAYYLEQKVGDAQEQLERSVALNPNDAAAHNELGIVYASQHKLDKAKDQFQQALELRPGFDDADVNLRHVEAVIEGKLAQ